MSSVHFKVSRILAENAFTAYPGVNIMGFEFLMVMHARFLDNASHQPRGPHLGQVHRYIRKPSLLLFCLTRSARFATLLTSISGSFYTTTSAPHCSSLPA